MIMRSEVTVGIDIGGTNTVVGFVDARGKCLSESAVPTQAQEAAGLLVELTPVRRLSSCSAAWLMRAICSSIPRNVRWKTICWAFSKAK
jgi:predicted NBD/HSP70 family sugar kinase